MQTWEYMVLDCAARSGDETARELNRLGESGWEVVAGMAYVLILKRPKS